MNEQEPGLSLLWEHALMSKETWIHFLFYVPSSVQCDKLWRGERMGSRKSLCFKTKLDLDPSLPCVTETPPCQAPSSPPLTIVFRTRPFLGLFAYGILNILRVSYSSLTPPSAHLSLLLLFHFPFLLLAFCVLLHLLARCFSPLQRSLSNILDSICTPD